MAAAPNFQTKNVKIGICKITYNGVELGFTKGGVEVTVATDTHKINIDQFGNTPVGEKILGRTITATAPLAETTLDNLVATMPGTTLTGTNTRKATINVALGADLRDFAMPLVLHPISLPDTDLSEDLVIPLAACAGALQFAYKIDDERIYNTTFNGYPAPDGTLFTIGNDGTAPSP